MSNSDIPETACMLRWTKNPPDDTGCYWFRADGMHPAIARIFFINGTVEAFGKHDL